MAIHNTDPHSINRTNPNPFTHDNMDIEQRSAHNTLSTSYLGNNTNPQTNNRIRMLNNMIVTYDGQNRVTSVYGYVSSVSTVTPIFVLAKSGFDVFNDILGVPRPAGL